MLNAGEGRSDLAHRLHRHTDHSRQRARRQHVQQIVSPPQSHLRGLADRPIHAPLRRAQGIAQPQRQLTVRLERSFVYLSPTAEPEQMRRRVQRQRTGIGVVVAQKREIPRSLVGHDVALGGYVCLHRLMPVQVIGRDVEHRRDVRAHRHHLQLKTREFHHPPIVRPHPTQVGDQGVADVASYPGAQACHTAHLPYQCRRRRLASRARDADDRGWAAFQKQLRVVAQRDGALLSLQHDGGVQRHPTAEAQQIGPIQQTGRVFAQHVTNGKARQFRQPVGQHRLVLQIRHRHLRTGLHQEARQRHPLPRQAKDHYSLFCQPFFLH